MSVEVECCAVRERGRRLRAAKFLSAAEKREAIREVRSVVAPQGPPIARRAESFVRQHEQNGVS